MYSQRIIDLTLDGFEQENGWRPEPKSIGEVDEFIAYIDSLVEVNPKSNKINTYFNWKEGRQPSPLEIEFIQQQILNEQLMCFSDARYFVTRYSRIRTVDERIVRIEFRIAQDIFHKILGEFEDIGMAIQFFILKCRQVGISTIVAQYFIQRILFRSNTYAIMASAKIQQSEKLLGMVETTLTRLPFWLPPAKTILKTKEPKWANGSRLSIQAGSQTVGIAQGDSPSCIHISELADYVNPKHTIEEGLYPAAHQTSSLFFVMEGTGSMATPWQKEKWEFYKENWGKGGRFKTLFFPPACASDLYPHADWIRNNPIPPDWNPPVEAQRMKNRCELFVRSTDYLSKYMGSDWKMDRNFLWYWTCGWNEAKQSHTEKTFLAQWAVTDTDAFQSEFDPIFRDETINIINKVRERAYIPYAITGKTILHGTENEPFKPDELEIDRSLPELDLNWTGLDENTYKWTFIPLKPFDDSTDEACFDKLLMFHPPEDGAEYAISVDTADGLGLPNEDRSTLSVQKKGKRGDRDVQVASFTSLTLNSAQMSRIAAAVAVFYGTDGVGNITSGNEMIARFIIEQRRKAGDECQHQLKIMGFLDHHIMHSYDDKGNIDPNKGTKEGWFTGEWSRYILLNRFISAVTLGWLKLNDPIVLRQLKTFVRRESKTGKKRSEMGHDVGEHDDNIFACAMGWTTLHDLENWAERLEGTALSFLPTPPEPNNDWHTIGVEI